MLSAWKHPRRWASGEAKRTWSLRKTTSVALGREASTHLNRAGSNAGLREGILALQGGEDVKANRRLIRGVSGSELGVQPQFNAMVE